MNRVMNRGPSSGLVFLRPGLPSTPAFPDNQGMETVLLRTAVVVITVMFPALGLPTDIAHAAPPTAATTTTSTLLLAPAPKSPAILHVMVDPGHGGKDKGAVRGSLKESEIALKVSLHLASLLKADPRFHVSLTRSKDESLTLRERTELAREAKADLYVSIHLNSSTDPRARGKEFYFQNQLPADEEALFLASRENAEPETAANDPAHLKPEKLSPRTDLRRILEDLQRNERIFASSELSRVLHQAWTEAETGSEHGSRKGGSRAIRQAPFFVVSNVNAPSVLIELGFLSHAHEGPRLGQTDYQRSLATSLYKGLVKYKETVDNDSTETLKSVEN